jgi:ubiquinone/menaquinone biosynthesis C-methylase UbiE
LSLASSHAAGAKTGGRGRARVPGPLFNCRVVRKALVEGLGAGHARSLVRSLPRSDEPELMDVPGQPDVLVRENLHDLTRVNRWLGGTRLTLDALDRALEQVPKRTSVRVLDIGSGAMDIPIAVHAHLRRRGLRPLVIGTDVNQTILRAVSAPRAVRIACADARELPLPDRSVDIAMCSLVLHHLGPADAVTMLREMGRVATRAILVNDLLRSRLGLAGAWLVSRVATRNPLSRHDAPLSVRRAYTKEEMQALAEQAGLRVIGFAEILFHRVAMSALPAA